MKKMYQGSSQGTKSLYEAPRGLNDYPPSRNPIEYVSYRFWRWWRRKTNGKLDNIQRGYGGRRVLQKVNSDVS